MTTTHLLFLLACAGHLVLWRCAGGWRRFPHCARG